MSDHHPFGLGFVLSEPNYNHHMRIVMADFDCPQTEHGSGLAVMIKIFKQAIRFECSWTVGKI